MRWLNVPGYYFRLFVKSILRPFFIQSNQHINIIGNERVKLVEIGKVKWTRQELKDALEEFSVLYNSRPIKNNSGGMKSTHMFLSWFIIRSLKPDYIIESGIYKGLGTWFFEKAAPKAKIHSIDLDLSKREYISRNAVYHNKDFRFIDWRNIAKENALCFFDDHQNAVERIKVAEEKCFKRIIFEDNYPTGQGDCYSLKQAFDRNSDDAAYLKKTLKIYNELPPIFQAARTRWNDAWINDKYPTPEPLYRQVEKQYLRLYFDEATYYTWMCYVELT
jgi:hypothetical protein